jgi:hypothetical protein
MTENRFETALKTLLEDQSIGEEIGEPNLLARSVATFAERGVLTRNAGLVVRLQDGSEFQITIVQSQQPDEPEGDPVDEDAACPNCGERDSDKLLWLDDDQVRCITCDKVYQPNASE